MATIEFYKIYYTDVDGGTPKLCDAMNSLVGQSHIYPAKDYCRDVHHLTSFSSGRVAGVFRKLRPDDGIEYGEAGSDGKPLDLADNEAIFEVNHFMYFPQYDIIGYVRNKQASHYTHFRNCLTYLLGRKIGMIQLLEQSSIAALLNNKNVFELSYAMPISPLFAYDDGDLWSSKAIKALSESGGDQIDLTVKINRRKKHGWLLDILSNVTNIMGLGATKLEVKAETLEGEELSPINLLATKILYIDDNFSYTKNKYEHADVYKKILHAYIEKLDEIEKVQRAYQMAAN
ncbi:hypothetical protein [Moraxella sp. ZY200743]|uniref:hypothetical protein n=1 Tax=Moraxella sp. ZY200743 TaxID=2911970 RepID=UPI003D7D65A5